MWKLGDARSRQLASAMNSLCPVGKYRRSKSASTMACFPLSTPHTLALFDGVRRFGWRMHD